jgi:hypothetical protein
MITVPTSQVDAPRTIIATPQELKASKYDSPNIQAALEALHQDGFVVLKSVVDVAHVDHINSFMTKEADALVTNNAKPFNQGVNCTRTTPILSQQAYHFIANILQGPPLKDPEYLYDDVFFNSFAIQLINA